MTPIVSFLQDGRLSQDAKEAKKIKKRLARFTILNDTLYKRGFSMPYLSVSMKMKPNTSWKKSTKEFTGTILTLDPW